MTVPISIALMRRTVSYRTVIGVALFVAILLAIACGGSPQEKETRFLQKGKSYEAQKDYPRAVLQFKNAVEVMPRDANAYYQLGVAELSAGHLVPAVSSLKKATELNPGLSDAQVRLAELMGMSGIKDVAKQGETRMKNLLRTSPDNLAALNALAIDQFQLGELQDAEAALQRAVDKFPTSVGSAIALAKIETTQGDLKSAEQVLRKAILDSPQSPALVTALGQLYMFSGSVTEAEQQFHSALKVDSKFAPALIGLAAVQIRLGHKQDAEHTYQVVSTLGDKRYSHVYAAYLFQEGKRDAAIKQFEQLANKDPANRQARMRLIAAYLLANRAADAENAIETALKANPNDVDMLLQQSELLLRSGRRKEAQSDLVRVLHFEPDSSHAHLLLAQIAEANGDRVRERQDLTEAVRLDASFLQARIQLAGVLIDINSPKAALYTLDAAPDEQKRSLALVEQRNWALLAMGEKAEARKWLDRALTVARTPDLLAQDAILKFGARDYAGVRASATEELKRNPEDRRALRLIADTYVAQKQPAAQLKFLQVQAAQHPKSAAIQEVLGERLLAAGDLAQAGAAFTAAKGANPSSIEIDMDLVRLEVAEGKLSDARQSLTHVLSLNGGNTDAHLWLGTIEERAGDSACAIQEFRKVLQADENNVSALNNLAYLLINSGRQNEEALKFAERARELAPDNPDAEGTLGWVLFRKGMYSVAIKYLEDAVAKDGRSSSQNAAVRKYHLSEAYMKVGDQESGRKALAAALEIYPNYREPEFTR